MNNNYLMRSLMFVPAHNKKLLESASRRDADVLLLDIEDSVPPCDKQLSRDNILEFVKRPDLQGKLIFPRVNGTFKIIPLIETTGAVMNIQEICTACNRVIAVAFGCEDFVTDMHGKHDADGISIMTARNLISMGARCSGVIPIDTVHIRVHDLEDLEKNLIIGKNLGFEGMLVLNPKELPLVHKYYSPSCEEVEWASEMIRLSEEAKEEGKGVAVKDNKFIGPPMVKMAREILEKHNLILSKSMKH